MNPADDKRKCVWLQQSKRVKPQRGMKGGKYEYSWESACRHQPTGQPTAPTRPLLWMFDRLRSDPRQLDGFWALLETQYITQATLAFTCLHATNCVYITQIIYIYIYIYWCPGLAQACITASACACDRLKTVKRGPISSFSSALTTCHGTLPDAFLTLLLSTT